MAFPKCEPGVRQARNSAGTPSGMIGPEDVTGENGLLKQLTKALIECAMQTELTEELGYEKNQKGEKQSANRRNGSNNKTLRSP
jgi:transposase-like protein